MPRERIKIELGKLSAKQTLFFKSRALYTAYGGAKGGGKTHAVRVKAVAGAVRYPGMRVLILRRTYAELQQNHIEPMLRLVPDAAAKYNGTNRTLTFRNGSVIKFGHYQSATAEREYQGQEYDWIFMDEATQFYERDFRYLGSCLRGASSIPKRFYITCNPGGVGHGWVKRLFIDREYQPGERAEDYSFIFAFAEDNVHLLRSSPEYLRMLEALPENQMRAYRYGDWSSAGGTYFSEFSEETHVSRPFELPRGWTRYRSFDYGLDMLSCLWIAEAPDGRHIVYRELRRANLVASEAAREMLRCTPRDEEVAATFAPPDMWNRQKDSGRTMAEIFMACGISLVRAGNARISGHMQIKEFLRMRQENVPALTIFSVCPGLINDVSRIESDRRDPNDCAKIPHDVTHAVDALRYYCSSRTLKTANATAEYEAAFDDPIWRTEIDADDGPEAGLDYALKFAAEL